MLSAGLSIGLLFVVLSFCLSLLFLEVLRGRDLYLLTGNPLKTRKVVVSVEGKIRSGVCFLDSYVNAAVSNGSV